MPDYDCFGLPLVELPSFNCAGQVRLLGLLPALRHFGSTYPAPIRKSASRGRRTQPSMLPSTCASSAGRSRPGGTRRSGARRR